MRKLLFFLSILITFISCKAQNINQNFPTYLQMAKINGVWHVQLDSLKNGHYGNMASEVWVQNFIQTYLNSTGGVAGSQVITTTVSLLRSVQNPSANTLYFTLDKPGFWKYNAAGTMLDDGGFSVTTTQGKHMERLYSGKVYATWFPGVVDDSTTDCSAGVLAALNSIKRNSPFNSRGSGSGIELYFPKEKTGKYKFLIGLDTLKTFYVDMVGDGPGTSEFQTYMVTNPLAVIRNYNTETPTDRSNIGVRFRHLSIRNKVARTHGTYLFEIDQMVRGMFEDVTMFNETLTNYCDFLHAYNGFYENAFQKCEINGLWVALNLEDGPQADGNTFSGVTFLNDKISLLVGNEVNAYTGRGIYNFHLEDGKMVTHQGGFYTSEGADNVYTSSVKAIIDASTIVLDSSVNVAVNTPFFINNSTKFAWGFVAAKNHDTITLDRPVSTIVGKRFFAGTVGLVLGHVNNTYINSWQFEGADRGILCLVGTSISIANSNIGSCGIFMETNNDFGFLTIGPGMKASTSGTMKNGVPWNYLVINGLSNTNQNRVDIYDNPGENSDYFSSDNTSLFHMRTSFHINMHLHDRYYPDEYLIRDEIYAHRVKVVYAHPTSFDVGTIMTTDPDDAHGDPDNRRFYVQKSPTSTVLAAQLDTTMMNAGPQFILNVTNSGVVKHSWGFKLENANSDGSQGLFTLKDYDWPGQGGLLSILAYYQRDSTSYAEWRSGNGQRWFTSNGSGRSANITEKMRLEADGRLGIGTTALNAAAILHVNSTTKGVLFPSMTTTQRDAIAGPPDGLLVYNNAAHAFQYYNSNTATWTAIGSGSSSGTVTGFSAGTLSPLFTTTVTNSSSTPALSFTLSNAAGHKFFGNNTGSTTAPALVSITSGDLPDLSSLYQIANLHNYFTNDHRYDTLLHQQNDSSILVKSIRVATDNIGIDIVKEQTDTSLKYTVNNNAYREYGRATIETSSTLNAFLHHFITPNGVVGTVTAEFSGVAADGSKGYTIEQKVSFLRNASGTITLGTPQTTKTGEAFGGLAAPTIVFAVGGADVEVSLTPADTTDVFWSVIYKLGYVQPNN